MVGIRRVLLRSAAVAALLGAGGIALAQEALTSAAQAELGRTAYAENCASCHGSDMTNGQFAPALKGPAFLARWGDQSLDPLLTYMHRSMPPVDPGGLPDGT